MLEEILSSYPKHTDTAICMNDVVGSSRIKVSFDGSSYLIVGYDEKSRKEISFKTFDPAKADILADYALELLKLQ